MRPRKRITIIDQDEQRLSRTTFLLNTRGFRVTPCSVLCDASDLQYPNVHLVICYQAVEARILPNLTDVPVLQVVEGWDSAWLVERARVLTVGKRGPRKKAA